MNRWKWILNLNSSLEKCADVYFLYIKSVFHVTDLGSTFVFIPWMILFIIIHLICFNNLFSINLCFTSHNEITKTHTNSVVNFSILRPLNEIRRISPLIITLKHVAIFLCSIVKYSHQHEKRAKKRTSSIFMFLRQIFRKIVFSINKVHSVWNSYTSTMNMDRLSFRFQGDFIWIIAWKERNNKIYFRLREIKPKQLK